ncbi:leishmanolysin-related zinc metalloendopeptidase [Rhodopirellula europaea]|uniref:Zinc metalloendopeptidase n=1 Tax=Rhodopirellula europaea 6C TaxID=1263867 RepID=M2AZG2_9BACT|nr:leishmanolysin-related zinc metalloendopeptidase [Rhodopirellula europaea]EMB15374.1 zinc metalloendopeptidase [Rhodopirellula europaea 6C]
MRHLKEAFGLAVFASLFFARSASAALVVEVDYTGVAAYEAAFQSAANTWQGLLGGYQDGLIVSRSFGSSAFDNQILDTVRIQASVTSIDGAGGTLGQAGFTEYGFDSSGYKLATDGQMQFDADDIGTLSSSQLNALVLHEMAHVLGFGTLWTDNSVYVNGSGEFTGANATAVWQIEFGQIGTPDVELSGGTGTANGHWNEFDNGANFTGITDGLGRDMTFELMTGWLNPNSFISELTLAAFRDIGFATTSATAVPEPGSTLLWSVLGLAVEARRKLLKRRLAS